MPLSSVLAESCTQTAPLRAVISAEPKEFTVVNIVGPINLEKLTKLEGQFGVPDLGIEQAKPKKNQ